MTCLGVLEACREKPHTKQSQNKHRQKAKICFSSKHTGKEDGLGVGNDWADISPNGNGVLRLHVTRHRIRKEEK
jgi:hypothetical protein